MEAFAAALEPAFLGFLAIKKCLAIKKYARKSVKALFVP